jgi:ferredoxin, 2Fe-2S
MSPRSDESLLELCIRHKVPISHSCEGMASCGTCRVIIKQGLDQLHERNPLESEMASDRNFNPEERLACQLSPNTDLAFILPEDQDQHL